MIGQTMFRKRLKRAWYYPDQQAAINGRRTNVAHIQTSTGEYQIHHSLAQQRYSQTQQAMFEQSLRNQAQSEQLRVQYTQAYQYPRHQDGQSKRVTWRDVHNVQSEKLGNSLYTKPKATGCGCGAR